jgi:hypothetical protein
MRPEGYLPFIEKSKGTDVHTEINMAYEAVVASLNMAEVTLKKDEYFLMGDNRGFSNDSVDYGAIHWDDVDGKVVDWGLRLPW